MSPGWLRVAALVLASSAGPATGARAESPDGDPPGAATFSAVVRAGGVRFSALIVDRRNPPRFVLRASVTGPGLARQPRRARGLQAPSVTTPAGWTPSGISPGAGLGGPSGDRGVPRKVPGPPAR